MRSLLILCAGLCAGAVAQAQEPVVAEKPLRAHLAYLASDLLEGRGTGQRGADLAVRYLEKQAAEAGLKPLPNGSYRQVVPMLGMKIQSTSQMSIVANGKSQALEFGRDVIYGSGNGESELRVDVPMVFVGYGIRAPEENWDDYKGVDVRGKLLLMMLNDPQPTVDEPNRFGGKSLTYYGRWDYKFEEAFRQGALGVLVLHTDASASYPFYVPANAYKLERVHLAGGGNRFEGWLEENASKALFTASGLDLAALRASAESRAFRPVELTASAHIEMHSSMRQLEQSNIIGIVPGSDPQLKHQAMVYSAHWDHLGKDLGKDDKNARTGKTDHIWNGAVDNASGSAALLAMAQAAAKKPARRTQIFFWPCAEEEGMLGSAAYIRQPAWPLAQTAANLNLDSMNFVGVTRDMGVPGSDASTLRATSAEVAAKMGLKLVPEVPDPAGSFFRSDHYNFVKAGIPGIRVGSSVFSGDGLFDFVNDPTGSLARIRDYTQHYHQVSDEYNPAWDLSGMVQQAQFTLNLGYAVANAERMPSFKGQPPR
ncbi:M28 family peptidase [Pseudoduganella violacea]|uniref:Zn-dependent M28 family amino/carboxypeptidase n=1 Tax=Pseudoduganella violacea TaxID=1715466 RepID=A0A7W5FS14_9BURK|nr:M28 family peptidase [Pseudoduganella violacea]MBB3117112.1 Zn-dependent M28 family amino/carboxypeptidase [Pseudoduganella violacea]